MTIGTKDIVGEILKGLADRDAGLSKLSQKSVTGRNGGAKVVGVLVPKLRLGTRASPALPANCLYFGILVEAEPRRQAFPGKAYEREILSAVSRFRADFQF